MCAKLTAQARGSVCTEASYCVAGNIAVSNIWRFCLQTETKDKYWWNLKLAVCHNINIVPSS